MTTCRTPTKPINSVCNCWRFFSTDYVDCNGIVDPKPFDVGLGLTGKQSMIVSLGDAYFIFDYCRYIITIRLKNPNLVDSNSQTLPWKLGDEYQISTEIPYDAFIKFSRSREAEKQRIISDIKSSKSSASIITSN
jgi:hypothetical protein